MERISTTPERLREALRIAGKKQVDLANETGLNKSTINRYMKGEIEPRSNAICSLASVLNVSEMWLWGYDVPMARPATQKKNDKLAKLVVRLRHDDKLFSIVSELSDWPEEKLDSLNMLIFGLGNQKSTDEVE